MTTATYSHCRAGPCCALSVVQPLWRSRLPASTGTGRHPVGSWAACQAMIGSMYGSIEGSPHPDPCTTGGAGWGPLNSVHIKGGLDIRFGEKGRVGIDGARAVAMDKPVARAGRCGGIDAAPADAAIAHWHRETRGGCATDWATADWVEVFPLLAGRVGPAAAGSWKRRQSAAP